MKDRELDRILSEDETIIPSSGFAESVMEAVRREALAPAPIRFPWKRALPGIFAGALVLSLISVGVVLYLLQGTPAGEGSPLSLPELERLVHSAMGGASGWVAFGLVVSLVTVKLSMRFASRRPSGVRYTA